MITNPGFSFSGISGTHKIVPVHETDLESLGENYNECIVCTYDGDLVKVYDNGPGFSYLSLTNIANALLPETIFSIQSLPMMLCILLMANQNSKLDILIL